MLGLVVVGACVVMTAGFLMLSRRTGGATTRAIGNVPLASPRALAGDARVRVVGIARSIGTELTTNHGARRCLAYRARVFVGTAEGDGAVCLNAPFALDADGVTIEIAEDPHVVVDVALHVVLDKLGTHAFGSTILAREAGAMGGSSPTYSEGVIEAGVRVAVVGTVELRADGTPRLVGTPAQPLMISNQLKALV